MTTSTASDAACLPSGPITSDEQRLLIPLVETPAIAQCPQHHSSDGPARYVAATPEASATARETVNLIVNYIPTEATDDEFRQLFAQFGEVDHTKIVRDRATNLTRGYGFVKFKEAACAVAAMKALNGMEMYNKRLKISDADRIATLTPEPAQAYGSCSRVAGARLYRRSPADSIATAAASACMLPPQQMYTAELESNSFRQHLATHGAPSTTYMAPTAHPFLPRSFQPAAYGVLPGFPPSSLAPAHQHQQLLAVTTHGVPMVMQSTPNLVHVLPSYIGVLPL